MQRFEREHIERVEFYEYLQWQADEQLARAAARAEELDAIMGLYVDLSISIDRSGAEAWAQSPARLCRDIRNAARLLKAKALEFR